MEVRRKLNLRYSFYIVVTIFLFNRLIDYYQLTNL